jgi:hypothetical protein
MTSREFIQKQFGNADGKTKTLSSIFKDERGNIYSYGRHYPLLFKVGELVFRNNTGYSNTTAKHIGWAGSVEPGAIDVWLSGTNLYTWNNPENSQKVPAILRNSMYFEQMPDDVKAQLLAAVFADLEAELVDINARIGAKTRTDTQIYRSLLAERSDCIDRIASVRPYVKAGK